jgi:hypothetical protein
MLNEVPAVRGNSPNIPRKASALGQLEYVTGCSLRDPVANVQTKKATQGSRSQHAKGGKSVKKLFEQYRGGKGTLVISFNDQTTITGDFVKENGGFIEITGQVNAIGQTCYVPYPNENIKYMYWKDPDAATPQSLP